MAGGELDGLALVDGVGSAGHSVAITGTRAGERSRHRQGRASAP